jgi:hypothetical protein
VGAFVAVVGERVVPSGAFDAGISVVLGAVIAARMADASLAVETEAVGDGGVAAAPVVADGGACAVAVPCAVPLDPAPFPLIAAMTPPATTTTARAAAILPSTLLGRAAASSSVLSGERSTFCGSGGARRVAGIELPFVSFAIAITTSLPKDRRGIVRARRAAHMPLSGASIRTDSSNHVRPKATTHRWGCSSSSSARGRESSALADLARRVNRDWKSFDPAFGR